MKWQKRKTIWKSQSGMTLIELLIASAITAIGAIGLSMATDQLFRSKTQLQQARISTGMITSLIANLRGNLKHFPISKYKYKELVGAVPAIDVELPRDHLPLALVGYNGSIVPASQCETCTFFFGVLVQQTIDGFTVATIRTKDLNKKIEVSTDEETTTSVGNVSDYTFNVSY